MTWGELYQLSHLIAERMEERARKEKLTPGQALAALEQARQQVRAAVRSAIFGPEITGDMELKHRAFELRVQISRDIEQLTVIIHRMALLQRGMEMRQAGEVPVKSGEGAK